MTRCVQVRSDMLVRDWLDYWYQNYSKPRLRPSTQLNYESWISHHLIPEVGDIQLNQMPQAEYQQFFRRMEESRRKANVWRRGPCMADRSVRSCHAVCQMASDKAVWGIHCAIWSRMETYW